MTTTLFLDEKAKELEKDLRKNIKKYVPNIEFKSHISGDEIIFHLASLDKSSLEQFKVNAALFKIASARISYN